MKNKKKSRRLIIAAVVSALILTTGVSFTGCKEKSDEPSVSETSASESETVEETTEAPTEPTTEATTTTEHVSPIENVNFSMGSEKSDINEIMDYDSNKTYKAKLNEFVREGDKIDSFIFVFYAEDGSSNISSYKGACGISVDNSCPAATDDGWYQSDDFEMDVNSAYLEVKWDVPSEIRDYINTGDKGSIEVGYWWGGLQKLRLSSIICNYTTSADIPVDGTKTIEPNKTLNYGREAEKTQTKEKRDR